jgi:hypothetical protein
MPADMLMIAVDWYGPFPSLRSGRETSVAAGVEEFLYLAISTDQESKSYVGISGSASTRLTEAHHVLGGLDQGDIDLWIGIVSSQTEAGRRPATQHVSHSESVRVAEHMIAYFLETSENISKRKSLPLRSAAVLSRWFRSSPPWRRWSQRAHPDWPDFIEFESAEDFARLAWFGGKLVKYDAEQIEGLRRTD